MSPDTFLAIGIDPALELLPAPMATTAARRMLVAIGLQESSLQHRRQIGGPARSYLQFELGGLKGVLRHDASKTHAATVVNALDMASLSPADLHAAMEYSDALACAMGRLLLFTHPKPLPDNEADGWNYYNWLWRPGKPHPDRWPACWRQASEAVE